MIIMERCKLEFMSLTIQLLQLIIVQIISRRKLDTLYADIIEHSEQFVKKCVDLGEKLKD